MSRALVVLAGDRERQRAHAWIAKAPVNSRVELKGPRRSLPQNDRMWAMLTDIASQVTWVDGRKYPPEDWKDYLMHALRKSRWMPDEDGGYVPIGMHSSELSKAEMGELQDLMEAFGASHGVQFTEPKSEAA